jgi:adenosylcobinamide hydrolase
MKIETGIDDITAEVKDQTLIVWSRKSLKILSSALLNGGLVEGNGIINVQVPEGSGKDIHDIHWMGPEKYLINVANKIGVPGDKVVGLMTAARMSNLVVQAEKHNDVSLAIFITAGATVAVAAGEAAASKSELRKVGTINIIVVVDGNLTDGSIVEVVKTATEAKTVAIRELDIRSKFSGELATGTLTDSIAVACTKKGVPIQYAGTFTIIGELIGRCVRNGVKEAISKQENITSDRPLVDRLDDRCLSLEAIITQVSDGKITKQSAQYPKLEGKLQQILSDPKVASLVLCALRLDEDLARGLVPKKSRKSVGKAAFAEVSLAFTESLSQDVPEFELIKEKPEDAAKLGPHTRRVLQGILKFFYGA